MLAIFTGALMLFFLGVGLMTVAVPMELRLLVAFGLFGSWSFGVASMIGLMFVTE